ncbi:MAG: TonB-dependent receptor [Sphingomonadales bacterium]|nr:TonB-dependent receptor [Sphingomonadales bacterium]
MRKLLAGASIIALGFGTATVAEAQSARAADTVQSDEIIVSATRRDEKLNSIPIAVQAMSGKAMEDLHINNFEKLVEYLPNVRTASTGPGVSNIYIRGLSSDQAGIQLAGVAGVQPNVGLYLNDMPAATVGRNLDIHATDLQRVEVLAGPQGTLFGASAMGGAIRYITNRPDLHGFHAGFTATASTTRHGDGSYSGEGFVNIPIIEDKLAVRLVAYNDHQGGYIDNVSGSYQMPYNRGGPGVLPTGNFTLVSNAIASCAGVANCVTTATGTSAGWVAPTRQIATNGNAVKSHFNDANYAGGRVELLWQVSPDWSVELMGMHQALKTDGVFAYDPSIGELKAVDFIVPTLRDTIDAATATVKGRIGMLDLILTQSFLNHKSVQRDDYNHYDSTGKYISYYQCDAGVYYNNYRAGNTCYAPTSTYTTEDTNKRYTTEFRVTTPADKPLRATLGLFYDHNVLTDVTDWLYAETAAGFVYNVTPAATVNATNTGVLAAPTAFVNTIKRTDTQFSVYGEVAYDIIPDKLTLTGGMRYYSDKTGLFGGSSSAWTGTLRAPCVAAPGTGTSAANPAVCNYVASAGAPTALGASSVLATRLAGINPHTYNGTLFKANLNYKIDPNSLVYLTYSQGYRPGGFNRRGCAGIQAVNLVGQAACDANRAYAPDKVYNYEIGTKLGLFNHQLQVNVAAYIIDWKNVLMTVFDENISNQTFINNFGNARIKGFEGDITIRPHAIHGLTLNAGFSYNDSKFLGCTDTAIAKVLCQNGVFMPAGSPLALSPKFQGNVRFRYDWETSKGLRPYVSAGMHYVGSSITSDVNNTDLTYGGPAATINGVAVNASTVITPVPVSFKLPSYTTFEASFGLARDQWSVEFYADNLSDARPQLFVDGTGGQHRITTSRPRTLGMRFSFKM